MPDDFATASSLPPKDRAWFFESRFGMFIHWGTYAMAARHEWVKKHEQISEAKYRQYFEHFNPDRYDPQDWARQARAAGMRYVVLTTKHHEGFCLWDSAHTDYKASHTPHGKDLLKPFVEAFRAEGLRVGFYYSLIDWYHPHYTIDRMHPRSPRTFDPEDFARLNEGRDQAVYAQYMRDQVHELLTGFGEISALWFDFSFPPIWSPDGFGARDPSHGGGPGKGREDWESEKLLALVQEHQPQCLVNNRLDLPGTGDFVTPEQYQPENAPTDDAGNVLPWEACQTFSGSWGYHRDETSWKSPKQLLTMLIDGVSKSGNLLLNVGPTARGEFDHRASAALVAMGAWMDRHARSIYGCAQAPAELGSPPPDCRYTYNAQTRRLYVHVLNWPFRHLHLHGLKDKVVYAQLLNDHSELQSGGDRHQAVAADCLTLELPIQPPPVEVPVIELMLA
ncbi:MAG: alpha-L-fucosidase [Opitutales bacterium]